MIVISELKMVIGVVRSYLFAYLYKHVYYMLLNVRRVFFSYLSFKWMYINLWRK